MNKQINKTNSYVIGGFIGAVIGVAATYLINKSSELEGEDFHFSSKRISNFALGTVSLLWSLISKGK
jgi:hypothetical protein